jgi:membrane protease YdiL (CAAX protease family)
MQSSLEYETDTAGRLDLRRIGVFLLIAFGVAWLTGLAIYLMGGLDQSPILIPGMGINLAYALLATLYMGAPALAHALTRILTREGWRGTLLPPRLRKGWPFWLAAWFLPALMTLIGAAIFFLLFPQFFDLELTVLSQALQQSGQPVTINPWLIALVNTTGGILLAPLFNSLFTFGEEFGWRAYLLPKLLPLGVLKAVVLSGAIWGVWHWPVIAMGYNYGSTYPGFPWLGLLLMVWFTLLTGVFLSWVTLRGASVWPAVIGHAAINGISAVSGFFVKGQPSTLLGPYPLGLVGSLGWLLLAAFLILRPSALRPREEVLEAAGLQGKLEA